MSDRPNVLFILSDQHNAKVMSHLDHPDARTPNLDRMAAEGVRFSNAITQNPICTPSRVSWLSGQYCHNHGYYGLSGPNPNGLPTILGHFRRAGYRTAAIGKIHCPEYWVEDDSDFFREVCGDCSIAGDAEYLDFLRERGVLEKRDDLRYPEFGNQGVQKLDARCSDLSYDESTEGFTAHQTIEFMKRCKEEGRPFFAHASLPRPHQVYSPSEPFWSMYDESKLTLPPNAEYEMKDKAPHMRATVERYHGKGWMLFEPKTYEAARLRKLHGYLGCVSQVDHAVGEMIDWLDANGLSENTIVVYSADHGDYACEHGIMEKAPGICSDAITRIPHIWRCPGRLPAGRAVDALVETVDFTATIAGLCGLDPLETSDGQDIAPLLDGTSDEEVRRIAVTENPWTRSVRKGPWRLVSYAREMFPEEYPDGFGELYNLDDDPWEMTNLFFDPAHADKVHELRAELLDWLITTTRPVTVHEKFKRSDEVAWPWAVRFKHAVLPDGKTSPEHIRSDIRGVYSNYL